MSLGSFLHKVGAWFAKAFTDIKNDADKVAITITEGLKTAIDSGVLPAIARLIPDGIGNEVADWLTKNGDAVLSKALALELGLQGLPDNPTASQLEAFEQQVITALSGSAAAAKSKVWTNIAVTFFQQIDTAVNASANGNLSFAQIVGLIEQAYQDYLQAQADNAAASEA